MFVASTFIKIFGMQWLVKSYGVVGEVVGMQWLVKFVRGSHQDIML